MDGLGLGLLVKWDGHRVFGVFRKHFKIEIAVQALKYLLFGLSHFIYSDSFTTLLKLNIF